MSTTITSLQNPTIKLIRSLAEKKYREETGLFVAEGAEVLARARLEGWEPVYLVATTAMALPLVSLNTPLDFIQSSIQGSKDVF